MEKVLLLAISIANAQILFCGESQKTLNFGGLKETVKDRSSQLESDLFDLRREHCLAKALSRRIIDLAESTKLFLQDVQYCKEVGKNKKGDLNKDRCIKKINKNVIPELLKTGRQIDKLDATIDSIFEKKKANRKEFFKALEENEKKGAEPKSSSDPVYKKFVNLGKAFRAGIDNTSRVFKELVDIQIGLLAKRAEILSLEELHLKINKPSVEVQNQELPDLEETHWSIGDWISSIFGKSEDSSKESNGLKEEFEKTKAERKNAEKELMEISDSVNRPAEPVADAGMTKFEDLDLQIKSLGESIQKLSANIDAQLEDLEKLTRNIAKETLSKIEL